MNYGHRYVCHIALANPFYSTWVYLYCCDIITIRFMNLLIDYKVIENSFSWKSNLHG